MSDEALARLKAQFDALWAEVERSSRSEERAWLKFCQMETERDEARAEVERQRGLLAECQSHILAAGHLSPRCEYHGQCRCDMDDLLQRLRGEGE